MCPPCAQVAYIFTANRRKSPKSRLTRVKKTKIFGCDNAPKKFFFPDVVRIKRNCCVVLRAQRGKDSEARTSCKSYQNKFIDKT